MEDNRMTFDMSLAPRNGYVISIGTSEVNTEIEARAVTLFSRNGTYRRSVIKAYICMIFTGNIQDMEDKALLEQDVKDFKAWGEKNHPEMNLSINIYWE